MKALLVVSLLLTGCETLSPQQFAATSQPSKDANATCATYDTIPSDVSVMHVNIDKGVVDHGEVEVKCGTNSVRFTNSKVKP